MSHAADPLTLTTAVTSWRLDLPTLIVVVVVIGAYWWLWHRAGPKPTGLNSAGLGAPQRPALGHALVFTIVGCGFWLLSACSSIGVYSDTLFWVRALQVVLLLMVVPFGLALGMPLSLLRAATGERGRSRIDALLSTTGARLLCFPAVVSVLLLATPWLIYLTGWYSALLTSDTVDTLTRLLLVAIGALYFYTRLQLDPVPRKYPQALSLVITTVEALGDGALGIILWQGAVRVPGYYEALHRTWGPSLRTDQTVGAGVLWILGDVVGLPFLLTLFARFIADDRERAAAVDADIDAAQDARRSPGATRTSTDFAAPTDAQTAPALWWEQDPQLRDRFRQ